MSQITAGNVETLALYIAGYVRFKTGDPEE
jgi:hypothetical protein